MFARFEHNLQRLLGFFPHKSIGVSCSGGVDSMVLAALTQKWARPRNVTVHGFIVDHGIRPESAKEQNLVAQNLLQMGITPQKLSISLGHAPKARLELVARNKRIKVLKAACKANGINSLLYGHHIDDQYETFLIRALKNSGWYGLAGISESTLLDPTPEPPATASGGRADAANLKALRPLLNFSKHEIIHWARENDIKWYEDATNTDTSLTIRNAIRKLRNEYQDVLPTQLKPENVLTLQAQFQARRAKADDEADALYKFQKRDGGIRLDYVHGKATLQLSNEFLTLGRDSQVSLIAKLVTFATPLPIRDMGYRRSSILDFVESGYAKKTIAEVSASQVGQTLVFERAKMRRISKADQTDTIDIHLATHEWSEWRLIDNRYWMRWKLNAKDPHESRHIGIYLNQGEYTRMVIDLLGTDDLKKKDCDRQPLLVFTEPGETMEISSAKLIGYPVLSQYQNLDVQWRYKDI